MHDKPIINLGLGPPGSNPPPDMRWMRHINFDHYKPAAESGAVMAAGSDSKKRHNLIKEMLGDKLSGNSGSRMAEVLIKIVQGKIGQVIWLKSYLRFSGKYFPQN